MDLFHFLLSAVSLQHSMYSNVHADELKRVRNSSLAVKQQCIQHDVNRTLVALAVIAFACRFVHVVSNVLWRGCTWTAAYPAL